MALEKKSFNELLDKIQIFLNEIKTLPCLNVEQHNKNKRYERLESRGFQIELYSVADCVCTSQGTYEVMWALTLADFQIFDEEHQKKGYGTQLLKFLVQNTPTQILVIENIMSEGMWKIIQKYDSLRSKSGESFHYSFSSFYSEEEKEKEMYFMKSFYVSIEKERIK